MTSNVPQAVPHGRPAARLTPKLQLMGRNFVMQLYMVLRTMKIHDPNNRALLVGSENLKDTINTLWAALGGAVRLQFVDDIVYLNDTRLRMETSVRSQVDALREEFAGRGLGGLAFSRPVDTTALRDFLVVFARPVESEEDLKGLRQSLDQLKELALELLGPRTFKDGGVGDVRVDRKTFALQTYAKSIVSVREFIRAIKEGRDPMVGRLHISRIVQDLVDIATERVNFLLKVSAIKRADDYVYNHSANTCVLSIAIGKALRIGRLDLVDLGTSALLAYVGFALVPPELVERRDKLSDTEKVEVHDAMVRSLRTMVGKGRLSDSVIRRVLVAYQHHLPYLNPESQQPHDTHIFSRIVAVADSFDALTTRRPWREGYTADEALRVLVSEAGTKYDPLIVRVFVNLMGVYPFGSAVQLDSGEIGVIYHTSNDPRLFAKPWVKIVLDPSGQRVKKTVIRNLAVHEGSGATITGMASASQLSELDPGMFVVI